MSEKDVKTFGERLKELRLLSGKTQVDVANDLGVSQQVISNFETTIHPHFNSVKMWAEYYNVAPDSLYVFPRQTISRHSPKKPVNLIKTTYDGEQIGSKLKELRLASGKSVETVASDLNLEVRRLSQWEGNRSRPHRKLIPLFAQYYGVDPESLFSLTRLLPENRPTTPPTS